MVQELRRRKNGEFTEGTLEDEEELFQLGAGLSAESMLNASPPQYGLALKLHVPIIYQFIPDFLQDTVSSWTCLQCFAPQWKERFLIQIGDFLYKFKSDNAKVPKGRPTSLDSTDVNLADFTTEPELYYVKPDPNYPALFCVNTFRKKQYFAVATEEEALAWVNSLREARQESVTRQMGHANNKPYPKAFAHFDGLARDLCRAKDRIRAKLQEAQDREMERSVGAQSPRGVYT